MVIYAATAAAATLLALTALNAFGADFRVPFAYASGDELTAAMGAKWLIQQPWVLDNPRLAAPGELDMRSWPQPDVFLFFVLKLFALTTKNFGVVLNLFYLATFPAIAVAAHWVLARVGIRHLTASFAALLYAMLPYHFFRGIPHLFLAAYQFVPLLILLALRLDSDAAPFVARRNSSALSFTFQKAATASALAICMISGAAGAYYTFFGCYLIAVSGAIASVVRRNIAPLLSAALLVLMLLGSTTVCLLPSLHRQRSSLVQREPAEAETLGLKIAQMVLPVTGHRWSPLANLKARYANSAPLMNENDSAAFGCAGAIGLLGLIGVALIKTANGRLSALAADDEQLVGRSASLAVAATLLGTIGGFSSLVAYFIYPQIRSYNRISIFVGFFALLGLAVFLDKVVRPKLSARVGQPAYAVLLLGLLALGIMDQTTPYFVPRYRQNSASFYSDAAFMSQIERELGPRAMVFQMPYYVFPYASRYDHARGFLQSETLRWSYGAIQDTPTDLWQRAVSGKSAPEMIADLRGARFAGIYIDRALYADRAARLESQLAAELQRQPIISPDSRLSFFRLSQ